MLIALLLSLAPALQSGAELHSKDANLFVELPDIQAFATAWGTSALPSLVGDEALAEVFALLEAPDITNPKVLLELLPAEFKNEVLPFLMAAESASFSLTVREEQLVPRLRELVMAIQLVESLDTVYWDLLRANDYSYDLPDDLTSLGLNPASLIDAFGNPYLITPHETGFSIVVTSLGSDGMVGGTGLAADWNTQDDPNGFITSLLAELATVHIVAQWNNPELAAQVNSELRANLKRMVSEQPHIGVVQIDEGSTAYTIAPEDMDLGTNALPIETAFSFGATRTEMLIGASSLEHLKGRNQGAGNLATNKEFIAAQAQVHNSNGAVVHRGFLNQVSFVETVTRRDPVVGAVIDAIASLSWKSGAWETRVEEGLFVSDSIKAGSTFPGDLNAVTKWIPNDAIMASAGTFDLSEVWTGIKSMLGGIEEVDFEMIEAMIGLDPSTELFGKLGHEYAVWSDPIGGLAPPVIFAVVSVLDGDQVKQSIDTLADNIANAGAEISVRRRAYKGVDITTVDAGIPFSAFTPNFAIMDGQLWFCNNTTMFRRLIRTQSKGELTDRGAHPLFADHQTESGPLNANFNSAWHFDLGTVLASYYSVGLAFKGMIPADANLPDGLIEALPDETIFTRHFPAFQSWTTSKGGMLHTHRVTPVMPETIGVGILGVLGGLVVPNTIERLNASQAMMDSTSPLEADTETLIEVTRATLVEINLAVLMCSIETGNCPENLEQLLTPTEPWPYGYMSLNPNGFLDAWGRRVQFSPAMEGNFTLYSFGPNGVDESGAGDDVTP